MLFELIAGEYGLKPNSIFLLIGNETANWKIVCEFEKI